MILFSRFFLVFLCLSMGACSAKREAATDGPLLPMPAASAIRDPGNGEFMTAIESYVRSKSGPAQTRYEFTRIDLNGDGRREGIVMLKAPHQYWCGFNGCPMAVFSAGNDGFRLISEISPVRGPLIVSEAKSRGWRDIIVRVSGRTAWETKDVALRFDGHSYPPAPAMQPPIRIAGNAIQGTRIFP